MQVVYWLKLHWNNYAILMCITNRRKVNEMGQLCVLRLLCSVQWCVYCPLHINVKLLRGSFEHRSCLEPVGVRAVSLSPWCFTAQLQSPIIYVYTHEQQMLVMLVNSIQSRHAFCFYLWTRCCMPVSAIAHTQQHLFPNCLPFS